MLHGMVLPVVTNRHHLTFLALAAAAAAACQPLLSLCLPLTVAAATSTNPHSTEPHIPSPLHQVPLPLAYLCHQVPAQHAAQQLQALHQQGPADLQHLWAALGEGQHIRQRGIRAQEHKQLSQTVRHLHSADTTATNSNQCLKQSAAALASLHPLLFNKFQPATPLLRAPDTLLKLELILDHDMLVRTAHVCSSETGSECETGNACVASS